MTSKFHLKKATLLCNIFSKFKHFKKNDRFFDIRRKIPTFKLIMTEKVKVNKEKKKVDN